MKLVAESRRVRVFILPSCSFFPGVALRRQPKLAPVDGLQYERLEKIVKGFESEGAGNSTSSKRICRWSTSTANGWSGHGLEKTM